MVKYVLHGRDEKLAYIYVQRVKHIHHNHIATVYRPQLCTGMKYWVVRVWVGM